MSSYMPLVKLRPTDGHRKEEIMWLCMGGRRGTRVTKSATSMNFAYRYTLPVLYKPHSRVTYYYAAAFPPHRPPSVYTGWPCLCNGFPGQCEHPIRVPPHWNGLDRRNLPKSLGPAHSTTFLSIDSNIHSSKKYLSFVQVCRMMTIDYKIGLTA